jgi:hypothetical protein
MHTRASCASKSSRDEKAHVVGRDDRTIGCGGELPARRRESALHPDARSE